MLMLTRAGGFKKKKSKIIYPITEKYSQVNFLPFVPFVNQKKEKKMVQ